MNKKFIFLTLSLCSVTVQVTASSLATLRRVAGASLRTLSITAPLRTQVDLDVQQESITRALEERFEKLLTIPAFWVHENGSRVVFDPALGFDFVTKERIVEVVDRSNVKKTVYLAPDIAISRHEMPNMRALSCKPFTTSNSEKLFENGAVILSSATSNLVISQSGPTDLAIGNYQQRWEPSYIMAMFYHELGHIFYRHDQVRQQSQGNLSQGEMDVAKKCDSIASSHFSQEFEADHFVFLKGGGAMAQAFQGALRNFQQAEKETEIKILQVIEGVVQRMAARGIAWGEKDKEQMKEMLLQLSRTSHPPTHERIARFEKYIQAGEVK